MRLKSKRSKSKSNFRTSIPEYNDEEILNILRKRKYYQPEAAEMAKQEAIKRGLINHEQDLPDGEFHVPPLKFRLFPEIEDERNRNKIRKSIARGLLIAAILPVVWGFLQFNQGKTIEGSLLVFGGLLWILFSSYLVKNADKTVISVLLVLAGISFLYLAKLLLARKTFIIMDGFIAIVLFGFVVYGLLYIRKLK